MTKKQKRGIIKVQKGDRNPIPTKYKIFNEVRIMKKLIKKDYFQSAINHFNSMDESYVVNVVKEQEITVEMLVKMLENEIKLLNKKNSGDTSKKMTPQQEVNEKLKSAIIDYMTENGGKYTITEMMTFPEVKEISKDFDPPLSNQRTSALVRQLLDETEEYNDESKPIIKIVEKRKSYFQLKD